MPHPLLASANEASKPIWLVTEQTWPNIAGQLPPLAQGFAKAQGFTGKTGSHCLFPDANGELFGLAFGVNGTDARHSDPFLPGKLPTLLPEGVYRFETEAANPTLATLAWLLGTYSFGRYRKRNEKAVRLVVPNGVDGDDVARIANAVVTSRDLVNTPTNDLGPDRKSVV